MKNEDIEKAAVNYDSRVVPFRAFVAGAQWRINTVWHDSNEIPNFKDLIPTLVLKFSKITFDFDGVKKQPGLRWLLEEGNWAGVLSGEFDNHIVENQTKGDKNDGYSY